VKTCYIIGGGLSGLTAANALKDKFNKTIVIEKHNDIGGLCQTYQIDGINYEFGPHVLYSKTVEQSAFWGRLITPKYIDYHVRCCIDGQLKSYDELFDFPISKRNISRLGESYIPQEPDYSNFENYMISQIGKASYETFVKNYNIKQWGIHPKDMLADWAKFRPLSLKPDNPRMFGDVWAGHPGSYRPVFDKLSQDLEIVTDTKVSGLGIDNNVIKCIYFNNNNNKISISPNDVVINTLPIDLFFEEKLDWRGSLKVFALLDTCPAMPTYSTTFPNNYSWTRIVEYPHHSGQENTNGKTLISFAIPYSINEPLQNDYMQEIHDFVIHQIHAKVIKTVKKHEDFCYPISSQQNIDTLEKILNKASNINNFYSIGRLGLFAYISMTRAIQIALELSNNIDKLSSPADKMTFFKKLREELW